MSEGYRRLDVEGKESDYIAPNPDNLDTLDALQYAHLGAESDVSVGIAETVFNAKDREEIFNGICAKWSANPDQVSKLLSLGALNAALEFKDKGSDESALKDAAIKHKTTVYEIKAILDNYQFNEISAAAEITQLQFKADVDYHEGALRVNPDVRQAIAEEAFNSAVNATNRLNDVWGHTEVGRRRVVSNRLSRDERNSVY